MVYLLNPHFQIKTDARRAHMTCLQSATESAWKPGLLIATPLHFLAIHTTAMLILRTYLIFISLRNIFKYIYYNANIFIIVSIAGIYL